MTAAVRIASRAERGGVAASLALAPGLVLPRDAVTHTFGVLAQKGVGKTHTASVLVEEMLAASLHVVVLDPTGAWWGLRADAKGTGPGYAVTILGGEHGDLPLESTAGAVVADLVVDEQASLVLDLSAFSGGEQRRFVTDFAERLYRKNREPLHLVIDEADEFAPQRVMRGAERMLGAVDRIVRRGRIKGIGVTMISQRAAVLHKDVLTQIDTLLVLRTTGPQDRAAIEAWVGAHGAPGQRDELLASLASLPIGSAWVWSPGWLGVFKRVQIRARHTFDSSATPKVGARPAAPRVLAPIDLDRVRLRMAETIERARADDPKMLRTELARVREALLVSDRERMDAQVRANARPTVPAVPDGYLLVPKVLLQSLAENLGVSLSSLHSALANGEATAVRPTAPRDVPTTMHPKADAVPGTGPRAATTPRGHMLAGGERKILTALAQYPEGRSRVQVAILTAYAHNGGGFCNYISALRTRELLEDVGGTLRITREGSVALGVFDPLPTGRALMEHWLGRLGKAERSILAMLVQRLPSAVTKEELARFTGYVPDGGGFNNAISRLRTLDLIEPAGARGRSELRASALLSDASTGVRQ